MISYTKTETRTVEDKRKLMVHSVTEHLCRDAEPADIIEAIKADGELRWAVRAELDGQPHIDWRATAEDNIKRAEKAETAIAAAEKERDTAIAQRREVERLCLESVQKSNKELSHSLADVENLSGQLDRCMRQRDEALDEEAKLRAEVERLNAENEQLKHGDEVDHLRDELRSLREGNARVKKAIESDALELRARRALDEWERKATFRRIYATTNGKFNRVEANDGQGTGYMADSHVELAHKLKLL